MPQGDGIMIRGMQILEDGVPIRARAVYTLAKQNMHNGGALCVLPASILLAPGLIGTAIYPAAFRPLTLGLVTGADALTRPAIATSFCSSMVRQNRLVARWWSLAPHWPQASGVPCFTALVELPASSACALLRDACRCSECACGYSRRRAATLSESESPARRVIATGGVSGTPRGLWA